MPCFPSPSPQVYQPYPTGRLHPANKPHAKALPSQHPPTYTTLHYTTHPHRYINEYPTGRLLRDAKLYEIGAGTSEIRRLLIGRELFKEACQAAGRD